MTLTYTRKNKRFTADPIIIESEKTFRKMAKYNKFIIPLALVKIILVFLVLQLFFSSCEQDDLFYDSALYTDGPLFEIEASLGTSNFSFESGADNFVRAGDTLFLEIALESNILFDQISQSSITLSDPEYYSHFVITDKEGISYVPTFSSISGKVGTCSKGGLVASFGDDNKNGMLMTSEREDSSHLMVGFVFNNVGSYTFHFVNTPNSFLSEEGSVDIYYERNAKNPQIFKNAYAVYLFQLGSRDQNYADDGDALKTDILYEAEYDQAIIDFTVLEKN